VQTEGPTARGEAATTHVTADEAEASDPAVPAGVELHRRQRSGWRAYVRAMGPGVVTGASDDDPSGVATYAQAGATFRLGLAWTVLMTLPLMATVQEICDRTALATGKSLGGLARVRFARTGRAVLGVLLVAMLVANALNIGADLVAVGEGVHLLGLGPATLWAVVAGAGIMVLMMTGSFAVLAHLFKVLAAALLAYVVVLFFVHANWGDVFTALVIPRLTWSASYVLLVVAVLGTTISPYLFFWQSASRIEELRHEPAGGRRALPLTSRGSHDAVRKQRTSRADVFTGMALSNVVMFAIIVATASTVGRGGNASITSATQAASALRPAAGSLSSVLFALGFVGSGMLAVPVLAGSASAGIAGLLGKPWGYSRSVRGAPVFYCLVAVGMVVGVLATLAGVDPIGLLVVVAVVNGIAAAPFLVVVMLISGDHELMGPYQNRRLARVLGWSTVILMAAASAVLLFQL
jgi:Mn2+/Fe2+ NRAMP family transporter